MTLLHEDPATARRASIRETARDLLRAAIQTEGLRLSAMEDVPRMVRKAVTIAARIETEIELTGPDIDPPRTPAQSSKEQTPAKAAVPAEAEKNDQPETEPELGSIAKVAARHAFGRCWAHLEEIGHDLEACTKLFMDRFDQELKVAGWPEAWATQPTPYLAEIIDKIDGDSPAEEVVLMSASAKGKTETGSVDSGQEAWTVGETFRQTHSDGDRCWATMLNPSYGRGPLRVMGVGDYPSPFSSRRLAENLAEGFSKIEGQRVAAVKRADKIAAERDHLARREALLTRDLRAAKLRVKGLECMLEEWADAADAAGLPKHEDPSERLRGQLQRTEVESIAKSAAARGESAGSPATAKLARVTVGDTVSSLTDGLTGKVIDVGERVVLVQPLDGSRIRSSGADSLVVLDHSGRPLNVPSAANTQGSRTSNANEHRQGQSS